MKAVIYLRVSSKDQNPEDQEKACIEFTRSLGIEDYDIFKESKSAWRKENNRPEFNKVLSGLKKGEYKTLVIWAYDRAYRNQKRFVSFMESQFLLHGVKVYSVQEAWITELWKIVDSDIITKIPPPYNEIVKDQLISNWKTAIKIIGFQAEEESNLRSSRVKKAVRKENGITISKKGRKWGRTTIEGKNPGVTEKIIKLTEKGKSCREISKITGIGKSSVQRIRKTVPKSMIGKQGV